MREGRDAHAEFGVVMMLFLIGLELEPAHFWRMRHLILGSGAVQVGMTACFPCHIYSCRIQLAGVPRRRPGPGHVVDGYRPADAERKGSGTDGIGKTSFAVLLFQDISVIPVLAVMPLLAIATAKTVAGEQTTFLGALPGWAQTIALLSAVGLWS